MTFQKTSLGLEMLKSRSDEITRRQRLALFLVDGKRTREDLTSAANCAGVPWDDFECLHLLGLITDVPGTTPETPVAMKPPVELSGEEFAAALRVATRLTAGLGLRGLHLNMAIERVSTQSELMTLAPRIRDAVGQEKFAALRKVLKGEANAVTA